MLEVGNDIGVFVSTDEGASWHDFRDGLPEVVCVLDLTISVSNRKLRAATHGNGVYQIELLEQPINTSIQTQSVLIEDVNVFPNPSSNIFNLAFYSKEEQDVSIKIYSSTGNCIYVENKKKLLGRYKKQINIKTEANGVFLLELKTDDGIINKKLIVQ